MFVKVFVSDHHVRGKNDNCSIKNKYNDVK